MDTLIVKNENKEQKAAIVAEVLADLPEWFGLPESTQNYIDESRDLDLWCAFQGKEVLGFISLSETSPDSTEIHCMAVKKAYHRQGLGRKLYQRMADYAKNHYRYIQVKTVDEGHYPEYDRTIAFYRSLGFAKLEVFPDMWDPWNPCLIMINNL